MAPELGKLSDAFSGAWIQSHKSLSLGNGWMGWQMASGGSVIT